MNNNTAKVQSGHHQKWKTNDFKHESIPSKLCRNLFEVKSSDCELGDTELLLGKNV